ncbi:unnamed protein product, partial [marine sediment metagenome]
RHILILLSISCGLLCGCFSHRVQQDGPPNRSVNLSKIHDAVPKAEPKSLYGNPKSYVANGKRYYVLNSAVGYNKRGVASWYGTKFHGHLTSTREPYNMFAMTAASPELPIPTYVRVTNLSNGRHVIVKVNDRGPFVANRIIDLSYAAAAKLGYMSKGTASVQVTAINPYHPEKLAPVVTVNNSQRYLQIGAFRYYANADELKKNISKLTGEPVKIATVESGSTPIYKVRIGPLAGEGESDQLQQLLQQNGFGEAITVVG